MLSSSCLRIFYSRTDVIIAGVGLQSLDLCIGHAVYEDLNRATHEVTRGLGLIDLIRRTAPCSCFLPQTRCTEVWGPILTRILIGILIRDKRNLILWNRRTKINWFFLHLRHDSILQLEDLSGLWWFEIWDSVEIFKSFIIHVLTSFLPMQSFVY